MHLYTFGGLLAALASVQPSLGANFTYNDTDFLLNGEPFKIIGGQMDAQRVPWQEWDSRLAFARAMGLNTISTYVYWNQIEDQPGQYITNGSNNFAAYAEKAQDAGLQVVLRVGPYICGEHEWGGFPAWLNNIDNMTVRSNNPQFLERTQSWLNWLGDWLDPLMINNGGPIIMVQVENEYGFYDSDHTYTSALAAQFESAFTGGAILYTNDGPDALEAGAIPNILAETDGSTIDGPKARAKDGMKGPNMDGEYYITWLDQWGQPHQSIVGNTERIASIQADLAAALDNNTSFSLYMFNGGTNFGFQNGADWGNSTLPITTSYDYGAPLDESGRPTDIYYALREALGNYTSDLPDVPDIDPMINISSIDVKPAFYLFDALPTPQTMDTPVNMEQLNQWYGFTLYRYNVSDSVSGLLTPGVAAKDRIIVYVNGERQGVIDSLYPAGEQQNVTLDLKAGDTLDLLSENLGRINFGSLITSQTKGVIGDVKVSDTVLSGWDVYTLPLESGLDKPSGASAPGNVSSADSPIFYTGTFDVSTPGDTFLELPGWTKGVIWVNGNNLGRFWTIGPQQSYFLPGAWLEKTKNTILILNLEPSGSEGTVNGVTNRTWAVQPDPDAP
ncbi:uncharacterized protein TRUGW13939_00753 [Talaromyces rugulosus]|uniref:Beta-galactosidase n=1 Tax=Talaromyces rugulosus TaxID=121627 RepID=A0A7H8QK93_TALRU|nr:uncharacterized protein TRUGW13939_00753 [Talaromyces rugulosus]QKX53673.1 hypothetical protein TRUGW13939_00753 [Talaromyces rugulosus]